ncbi:MAG: hypothetical protein IPJ34_13445 [Myxococcales bacterium]|nr:hypothetical protein [Myxococcales bacterium]
MWLFQLKDVVLVRPSALGNSRHVGDQELDNLGEKVTLRWHIITKGPLAGHFAGTEPGRRDLLFVYSWSLACRRPEDDGKEGIPTWLVRAPKAACPRAWEILNKNH